MSVPLDRLYHFLHDHCNHDVIIYHFYPHGSKKPNDVRVLDDVKDNINKFYLSLPVLMHDQEPLNFSLWIDIPDAFKIPGYLHSKLKNKVCKNSTYDTMILVHSELQSSEVKKFEVDGAIPVYYWSHAVIARDWFRYAEHDQLLLTKKSNKRFLIYNRAWQGSREYRLKFAELLLDNNLHTDCITSFSPLDGDKHYSEHNFSNVQFQLSRNDLEQHFVPNTAPSWASADYSTDDYQNTDIEVVLETLFDDSRLHITEKTLRALAVGQPFILCGTLGSLQYLQNYGFKTFDQCWDESYDKILDPLERLQCIVQLMNSVKTTDLTLARQIAQYNREHFFSKNFFNYVVNEFRENFIAAASEAKKHQTAAYFLRNYNRSMQFKSSVPLDVYEYALKLVANQSK